MLVNISTFGTTTHTDLASSLPFSGIARVLRLPGQMVGVAMCYKVNFDPGFEYLGLIFAAEVDEAKNH